MFTIGLIGGIASGKSTVSAMFVDLGAAVLDADRAAHEVLMQSNVRQQLVDQWGADILLSNGHIDRSAVARLVFGGSPEATARRKFLESLVHPMTRQSLERERRKLASQGQQVFVIDAPLLIEADWHRACDLVVMVDTPLEKRLKHAASRGWSPEELHRREQNQLDLESKRKHSDYLIHNDGTLAETRREVERLWNEVVEPRLNS